MDSDSGHDAPILIDAAEDDLPRLRDLDQLTEFILGHDRMSASPADATHGC
ncbi:hypothetical protein IU421_27995 [Nocardia cyriacigeorgica]|uniref:hypothetical protein n=1 Tax=Nocardia cyriacigeorgica TaxID=135487 RepID=UPI00189609A8|nr:hypothetical protein [Nocardia cyriacigeorgica]MBF6518096.1 hypothetical protein [Nocardia cyriacigeorgica]